MQKQKSYLLNDQILEFSLTAAESQLGTAMKRMMLLVENLC